MNRKDGQVTVYLGQGRRHALPASSSNNSTPSQSTPSCPTRLSRSLSAATLDSFIPPEQSHLLNLGVIIPEHACRVRRSDGRNLTPRRMNSRNAGKGVACPGMGMRVGISPYPFAVHGYHLQVLQSAENCLPYTRRERGDLNFQANELGESEAFNRLHGRRKRRATPRSRGLVVGPLTSIEMWVISMQRRAIAEALSWRLVGRRRSCECEADSIVMAVALGKEMLWITARCRCDNRGRETGVCTRIRVSRAGQWERTSWNSAMLGLRVLSYFSGRVRSCAARSARIGKESLRKMAQPGSGCCEGSNQEGGLFGALEPRYW
jgi:hypothetical protein